MPFPAGNRPVQDEHDAQTRAGHKSHAAHIDEEAAARLGYRQNLFLHYGRSTAVNVTSDLDNSSILKWLYLNIHRFSALIQVRYEL